MNRSFIKVLGIVFAIILASTYALANDAEVKEVEVQSAKSTVMPVITMPVQKDTVEQKVLTPAGEAKKETVKAVNEAVEDIKTTVENAKVETPAAAEEIKEQVKETASENAPKAEVPAAFEALQNTNVEPAPAVNTQSIETVEKKAEDKVEASTEPAAEEVKADTEEIKEETTANEEVQKEVVKEVKEIKKTPVKFDIKTLFESIRPEVKGGKKATAAADTNVETEAKEASSTDATVETEAE